MSVIYTGAGGWAYFVVPGQDPLTAYAKAFDFVEVNSTFYTHPSLEMVRSWRQRVPDDFITWGRGVENTTGLVWWMNRTPLYKANLSPKNRC